MMPADQPTQGNQTDDGSQPPPKVNDTEKTTRQVSENAVQRTRAWTGLLVVAVGDVAIVVAAVFGILKVAGSTTHATSVVAILSSGFTAVGTMTTAYFGIRAASNTAQSSIRNQ
jgi:hypothetical protein